jgi:hypothetical protein
MRKKGENDLRSAGKKCGPLGGIMISPLASKVNPSHLADFAAFSRAAVLWWEGAQSALQILRDSHQQRPASALAALAL